MNVRTLAMIATFSLIQTSALADKLDRVSVGNNGVEAIGTSLDAAISADGTVIAFASTAQNLAPNDTGSSFDVFIRQRFAGTTQRISATPFNFPGNGHSTKPALSADGRFVAFATDATNLFSNDTNGTTDVVLFDRETSTIVPVSTSATGALGNNRSSDPSISADGRFVAFTSLANNLLPAISPDTNGTGDVFVKDMQTGAVVRASVRANGGQLAQGGKQGKISADGRFVVFASTDDSLVVAGDANGAEDVFVRQLDFSNTIPVSRNRNFTAGNARSVFPSISGDGRFVAFQSDASDLVDGDVNGRGDVFVLDRESLRMRRVSVDVDGSELTGASRKPFITPNGRFVAWELELGPPSNDPATLILMRDLVGGTVNVVSRQAESNHVPTSRCSGATITASGDTVAYASDAPDLLPPDTNGLPDVFTYRLTNCALGDTLSGEITAIEGGDFARFEALAGTRVKVELQLTAGATMPSLLVVDARNGEIASFTARPSATSLKKKFTIPANGSYAFVFIPQDAGACSWRLNTSAKLPKAARSFTKNNAKSRRATGVAKFGLQILPGALVTVRIQERRKPINTVTAVLTGEEGDSIARTVDVPVERTAPRDLFTDLDTLHAGRVDLGVQLPPRTKVRIQVELAQPTGGFVVFVP